GRRSLAISTPRRPIPRPPVEFLTARVRSDRQSPRARLRPCEDSRGAIAERAALRRALGLDLAPCGRVCAQRPVAIRQLIKEDAAFECIDRFVRQLRYGTTGRLRQPSEAIPGLLAHPDRGAHVSGL